MNSIAEYMVPAIILTNTILAVLGGIILRYSRDKGLRALSLLLIIAMGVQLIQLILTYNKIPNQFLFYFYTPMEFALLITFLITIERKYKSEIKIFAIAAGVLSVPGFIFTVNGYPVYAMVILYGSLTLIAARVFFISNDLVVLGLLCFAALESCVLSSFTIPGLAATRYMQPVVNLFSNIIIIVGLYGRIRIYCSANDGAYRNSNTGNTADLLQNKK